MLPDTHFFVMLPQELLPDDIPVFRDNPYQPVHIFGMVTHQLGELLQLGFQPLHTPGHAFGLNDLFVHGLAVLAGKRGHNQITFHRNSFCPQAHRVSGLVLSLQFPKSIIPLSFHFNTVLLQFAAMNNIFTMILAGGKGERLSPLTEQRAKPAVPFGGKYRIIDFALSNCLNSGLRRIAVLIQYKSHSLDKHIRSGWNILNSELGEYIASVPPQQRISEEWYRGTADAVYQNMFLLDTEQADYLLILAGDHIYKMNYAEMFHWLLAKGADAVVGALDIPIEDATRFGVISVDEDLRINRFDEKPTHPTPIPGDPTHAFASMGIYLFKTDAIKKYLIADAQEGTAHDFGKNIIPRMIKEGRVYAFKFQDENKKAVKYWRDIGTLDAYWEANMDLVAVDPLFNLYDPKWPIRTYQGQFPPAKFVFAQDYQGGRMGVALDSVVCGGCIVSGGRVQNSVLSPNVRVLDHADVRESIVMENVVIGEHSRIRRAIIDKDVIIPPHTEIGYDREADARRFTVTESGLVVISKGMKLNASLDSSG
jgi:glucose-1-phosphate adenylyltransferase